MSTELDGQGPRHETNSIPIEYRPMVMYCDRFGIAYVRPFEGGNPVLVIPLDPANVERVVQVMMGTVGKPIDRVDYRAQKAWEDAYRAALTALINHAKETSK